MSQPSLADNAVDAIARVRSMGENLSDDHPMRHIVRAMKATAERMLESAMREATMLSHTATKLVEDHDDAMAEATKETQ